MNNKEFLSELGRRLYYNMKEAKTLYDSLIQEICLQLEDENTIAISGFGTFEVKKKLERVVVNPATKQRMLVPPKMSVSFKVAPVLKDKANEK
ncbi:MAG: HU family DNA-binding protein [Bacteroidaceae bacterium]|nr:HU family DNA-binding protein [Bacteroidaceae bacterium]